MNSQPWLTRTPKISVNEIKSINHLQLLLLVIAGANDLGHARESLAHIFDPLQDVKLAADSDKVIPMHEDTHLIARPIEVARACRALLEAQLLKAFGVFGFPVVRGVSCAIHGHHELAAYSWVACHSVFWR